MSIQPFSHFVGRHGIARLGLALCYTRSYLRLWHKHLATLTKCFSRVDCWTMALCWLSFSCCGAPFVQFARGAIVTAGNITATSGAPYNGTDDPWLTNTLTIGNTGPGSMLISGGSVVSNTGSGTVAGSTNASGSSVSVSDAKSQWTNSSAVYVGYNGAGSLSITNGGSVTDTGASIGFLGNGTVTIGGGTGTSTWTHSGIMDVGDYGTGTLNITGGGSVTNGGNFSIIGNAPGSSGTVMVGGGTGSSTWTIATELSVGSSGTGSLTITGGGSVSSSSGSVGGSNGSVGTATIGAGTGPSSWINAGVLSIGANGSSGTATVTITGGGTVSDTLGSMGGGSSVAVNVGGGTGTSTWINSSNLYIGAGGTTTLTITGGGSVSDTVGSLGNGSGTATVAVGGGTGSSNWTNSNILYVGSFSNGTLNITGGGTVSNTVAMIGSSSGIAGTVTVGGGTGQATWTCSSYLSVGGPGTGMLNINTGGFVSATALEGGNANSSIIFNGGTLQITATDSASNTLNLLSGGDTLDVPTTGTTFTVTSNISGSGNLNKSGQATLVLTGANSYAGMTTVSGGTLRLQGSGSIAASPMISLTQGTTLDVGAVTAGANFNGSHFALVSGQTLTGVGTVNGAMNVLGGAAVAPGSAIGTLNVNGISFTSATSVLNADIDWAGTGNADLLSVTGSVSLASSTLSLNLLNFTGAGLPRTYLLVSNDLTDAVTGTFGTISGLPPGYSATINYVFSGTDSLGRVGDGNDIALTITAVPEPSTVMLLSVGLVTVLITLRQRDTYASN